MTIDYCDVTSLYVLTMRRYWLEEVDERLCWLSGAQDFLPDYEQVPHWHSVYSVYPKYSPLFTAMRKAKEWMHNARVRMY